MDHWDTSTINLPMSLQDRSFPYNINTVSAVKWQEFILKNLRWALALITWLRNRFWPIRAWLLFPLFFLNEYWMIIDCKFIPLWLKNASIFIIMTIDTLVGNAHHQGLWLWRWMGPLLSYLFSALWVLPLFWLSKPLNSLWYQVTFYLCCLYHKFHLYSFAFQFEFFFSAFI